VQQGSCHLLGRNRVQQDRIYDCDLPGPSPEENACTASTETQLNEFSDTGTSLLGGELGEVNWRSVFRRHALFLQ
jgi:hypothetical protein